MHIHTTLRALAISFLLALGAGSAHAEATTGSFSVEINKGKLIHLKDSAATVVVSDPEIADVQVLSPHLVYASGRRIGETSVLAIGDNDKVVLEGSLTVTHNLSKLKQSILKSMPDARVDFESTDNAIVMKGSVPSPAVAERIQRVASSFLQSNQSIINMIDTDEGDQVMLKVKVAEVSRSELKRFGINLESILNVGNFVFGLATGRDIIADATGAILRSGTDNSIALGYHSNDADINGVIDALEDDGLLTVLAEPNLTTKSGVAANFLAGGEFPIPVVGENSAVTIEYRQFGVSLDFTPVVMSAQKINLTVRPEVSTLTTANGIQANGFNIPSLLTRRASTTVELGSGESFAIAGLLRSDHSNDISKVPALGDLPVLGALFRSNEFRQDQSELVIIVTPYIVKGVRDAELRTPVDAYQPASDIDRILWGKLYREPEENPTTTASNEAVDEPKHHPRLNGPAGFIMR
ncbi:MAG: type II and III secretion system protein family protein [Rickettsiales bacterium]